MQEDQKNISWRHIFDKMAQEYADLIAQEETLQALITPWDVTDAKLLAAAATAYDIYMISATHRGNKNAAWNILGWLLTLAGKPEAERIAIFKETNDAKG